ncbi:MAG: hypothetical protein PHR78_06585 [Eubacteriales bacterium]|nr:hypothetical protein [Eubacteriales bacterium]MDD4541805.1 hypothetical protein [Eubacteriales bacterium]
MKEKYSENASRMAAVYEAESAVKSAAKPRPFHLSYEYRLEKGDRGRKE